MVVENCKSTRDQDWIYCCNKYQIRIIVILKLILICWSRLKQRSCLNRHAARNYEFGSRFNIKWHNRFRQKSLLPRPWTLVQGLSLSHKRTFSVHSVHILCLATHFYLEPRKHQCWILSIKKRFKFGKLCLDWTIKSTDMKNSDRKDLQQISLHVPVHSANTSPKVYCIKQINIS